MYYVDGEAFPLEMLSADEARTVLQALHDQAAANTYPYIRSQQPQAAIEHEASTCRISEDQLFYLQSRGIGFEEAVSMMVSGFCRDVFNQLPMEFAAEADKLLALKLEGSVG